MGRAADIIKGAEFLPRVGMLDRIGFQTPTVQRDRANRNLLLKLNLIVTHIPEAVLVDMVIKYDIEQQRFVMDMQYIRDDYHLVSRETVYEYAFEYIGTEAIKGLAVIIKRAAIAGMKAQPQANPNVM